MLDQKVINNFKIIRLLGYGGMGEVYLAEQQDLERLVALKIIYKTMQIDFIERFKREAKIAAALQHPNIVNIYSIGEEKDFFYIAMEYVEGHDIQHILAEGALPEIEVWHEIALPVCSALQKAATKNIIHRDIKPANLMFDINGNVKLTDFGLSKTITGGDGITMEGTILGTPEYMSPEQATHNDLDFRSDIYSLGATVYHLLTGHYIFTGQHFVDILLKHKSEKVLPPQQHVPSLKIATSRILAKMLAKNPDDRYLQYEDLICDVDALINNKPLQYAKDSKILDVYTYNPEKKKTTSQRLKTWLMSPTKENQDTKTTSRVIKGTITSRIVLAMKDKQNTEVVKTQKKDVNIPLATKQVQHDTIHEDELTHIQNTMSEDKIQLPQKNQSNRHLKIDEQTISQAIDNNDFSNYIVDFYQEMKSTLLRSSTTAILVAFYIPQPMIYKVLEGRSADEQNLQILQKSHLLGKKLEPLFDENIFMHETFKDDHYQALLWSRAQDIAFVYIDTLSNLSKMSICHTNIFGIYRNMKQKIPV
ncbi:serine/threonine protein kinase [Candidatus Uabimicrobium amorphum]|uniref:Serine/threonine protein kinase n=1 Tax=Uabimicrobium amorphum TaxID=2596890 RepID=A0A5S9ILR4_UABAM|nr:serine/threonine-protein kinase [Candidatus Uabimicrobium amorphum]BBM82905.1 serine/threonine protein kinase [Candidatus Uabimicrobium amorphum]